MHSEKAKFNSTKRRQITKSQVLIAAPKHVQVLSKKRLLYNDEIKRIMKSNFIKLEDENEAIVSDYPLMYKCYINEVFSTKLMCVVSRIVKFAPETLSQYPLAFMITKICKCLLLNELELSLFSIYLEKLGWESTTLDFESYLYLIAIVAKMNSSDYSEVVMKHTFNENEHLEYGLKLLNSNIHNSSNPEILNVSIKELNSRYEKLTRPYNVGCKEDFVDYNSRVDQILKTSNPYSNQNKHKTSKIFNEMLKKKAQEKEFEEATEKATPKCSINSVRTAAESIDQDKTQLTQSSYPEMHSSKPNMRLADISSFLNLNEEYESLKKTKSRDLSLSQKGIFQIAGEVIDFNEFFRPIFNQECLVHNESYSLYRLAKRMSEKLDEEQAQKEMNDQAIEKRPQFFIPELQPKC